MTIPLRLGFDIGGTFTDFVLVDPATGALRLHKLLTTPQDPAIGAMEGLRQIVAAHGVRLEDVGEIVHGTTLVTNTVIERKGAKLGLLTTAGFRDVLEAGTEQRYDIYDLFLTYPEPLVPRRRRLEVTERIDRDGRIVTPLDAGSVRRAAPGWRRSPSASCTPTASRRMSALRRRSCPSSCRACRSPSRARWWPRSASTRAASPPAPTPMSSR